MEQKYKGPDATTAEAVYDSGYADCEETMQKKIDELEEKIKKQDTWLKALSIWLKNKEKLEADNKILREWMEKIKKQGFFGPENFGELDNLLKQDGE